LKKWKIEVAVVGLLLAITGVLLFFLNPGVQARKVDRMIKDGDRAVSAGQLLDAEILLRKAADKQPDNPDLQLKLGTVLEKEGVLEQAKEQYVAASKAKKIPEPGYQAGMVALKMNNRDEAERLLLENIASWPSHVPTLYQLGAIYAKQGKYEEAIKYFSKIVETEPKEAEAYNDLGFCYFSLEQPQKAKEMFLKALEINPNFESAKKSLETVEADLAGKPQQGSTAQKCPDCNK